MTQVIAKLNNLKIAPRKVRLIANALRGLSVNEAEAQLLFRPQRSSESLLKLLRSAIANAKNNYKLNPDMLMIKIIRVDQGPILKRFLPRAMGRATPIHKKVSHVELILDEQKKSQAPRFVISPLKREVKQQKQRKERNNKPKVGLASEKQKPQNVGFLKRIFQRKSV